MNRYQITTHVCRNVLKSQAISERKNYCIFLGWKYEHAFESSQKYKEGKFIIELAHMIKVINHCDAIRPEQFEN